MLLDAASLGNGSFPQPRLPAWSEAGRPPPPCWGPRLGPAPPGALQSWQGPQPGGGSVLVLGVLATLGAHGGARTPRRRGSRSAAPDCTVSFLRPPSFASPLRKPLLNSPRGGKQGEGKPLTWEAAPPGGALASPGISNGDSGVPGTPMPPAPDQVTRSK